MDEASKVVLITGSSRGIGAAIAELFAKQGALLSITGRNKDKLSEVAKKCKENGSKQVLETIADLTKEKEMNKLMEETIKAFGKLDVLVNNAGMLHVASVEDYTGESFDKILAINLKAPIYLTKIAKPHLALTKGNIVNMSSVSATRLIEGYSMYGITKSGLSYFTKATAASFAKDGIRCNAICPGAIGTELFDNFVPKEIVESILTVEASLLSGKVATVEDVANMAVFLASEKAALVTGECIVIDGGRYITKINE